MKILFSKQFSIQNTTAIILVLFNNYYIVVNRKKDGKIDVQTLLTTSWLGMYNTITYMCGILLDRNQESTNESNSLQYALNICTYILHIVCYADIDNSGAAEAAATAINEYKKVSSMELKMKGKQQRNTTNEYCRNIIVIEYLFGSAQNCMVLYCGGDVAPLKQSHYHCHYYHHHNNIIHSIVAA